MVITIEVKPDDAKELLQILEAMVSAIPEWRYIAESIKAGLDEIEQLDVEPESDQ